MKHLLQAGAPRLWYWGFIVLFLLIAQAATAAEHLKIVVFGVEGEALGNVVAALSLPPGLTGEDETHQRWLERFEEQAPGKVDRALAPFGFYNVQTATRLEESESGQFTLTVDIDPGEPVRVTQVRVEIEGEGSGTWGLHRLVREFPLKEGDVLRQALYEEAKGGLLARAIDLGFLNAEFTTHIIRVHRDELRAEIDLVLDTGPQFTFGDLLVHGAPDYPDRFLKRYQAFEPGDVFSYPQLGATQMNFLDSDRFKDVIITPRQDLAEEKRVPVDIQLVPSARKRLRPGIGYGTDTGARFSLRYKDVNLFHLGHELEGNFLIAQFQQSLLASYTVPSYRNIRGFTVFRGGLEREVTDTFVSRRIFAETERVYGWSKDRLFSLFVRLLQEDSEIGGEEDRSRMILPGVRFSQRRYRNPIRPQSGYSFSLEVRGGHQYLGSDTGLLQVIGSATTLFDLPFRLTLFLRGDGGISFQNEPLADVPPSLRFFAGGDKSVRGYGFKTLGPTDADGDVIGGKHMAAAGVELERAIGEDWGVAVFYDAGNAFNSLTDYNLFFGGGLGVRRYTQVGPVKLDLARQLAERDPDYRIHLSIGFGW